MPRSAPSSTRAVLVLLTVAAFLGWLPRSRRMTSLRRHVELLQRITPIQQFAPAASQRVFVDLAERSGITIIAHRVRHGDPYQLVPVDDRQLEAWLA